MSERQFCIYPYRAQFDQSLGSAARLVLLALSGFTDRDGYCWPSVGLLAEVSGFSERTVREALADLAGAGWIEVEPRFLPNGAATSNGYFVRFDAKERSGAGLDREHADMNLEMQGEGAASRRGTLSPTAGAPAASRTLLTSRNESVNEAEEGAAAAPPARVLSFEEAVAKRPPLDLPEPGTALDLALAPYLRMARMPAAIIGTITALKTGMHGPAYDEATITQALVEMQAANCLFSAAALRGFCRKVAESRKDDRARAVVAEAKPAKPRREPVQKRDPDAPLPDWRTIVEQTASEMGAGPVVVPEASSRETTPPPLPVVDSRTPAEKAEDFRRAAEEARLRKQAGGGS